MIPIPSGVRVWLALGHTDMRRGMRSLALQVQQTLNKDVHAGDLYVFRGAERIAVQDLVARRPRDVVIRKTLGTRTFCLAICKGWDDCDLGFGDGLPARRRGLAQPAGELATNAGRMILPRCKTGSSVEKIPVNAGFERALRV